MLKQSDSLKEREADMNNIVLEVSRENIQLTESSEL